MQSKTGALGLSAKSIKTPWHLRFGEKLKTAATAVIVGIIATVAVLAVNLNRNFY